MTISGFLALISLAVLTHEIGFIEFILLKILMFLGAGASEYCVLPGNRIDGYCKVNVCR
jgi:uncharacterized membrane protein